MVYQNPELMGEVRTTFCFSETILALRRNWRSNLFRRLTRTIIHPRFN